MRYMTIGEAINYADQIKQNSFPPALKTMWLNELEYRVQYEIMLLEAENIRDYIYSDIMTVSGVRYTEHTVILPKKLRARAGGTVSVTGTLNAGEYTVESVNGKEIRIAEALTVGEDAGNVQLSFDGSECELLVPAPFAEVYYDYLLMKIAEHLEESTEQNNRATTFKAAWTRYAIWFAENYAPADGRAAFRGYYIKGDNGNAGAAATVSIGTVTTGEAGSEAAVINSGTENAAVFDFVIPQGPKGDAGAESGMLISCTYNSEAQNYTVDKSFDEIAAAIKSGKLVMLRFMERDYSLDMAYFDGEQQFAVFSYTFISDYGVSDDAFKIFNYTGSTGTNVDRVIGSMDITALVVTVSKSEKIVTVDKAYGTIKNAIDNHRRIIMVLDGIPIEATVAVDDDDAIALAGNVIDAVGLMKITGAELFYYADGTISLSTATEKFADYYKKPSGGIPAADLSNEVQGGLKNAATAYRKPASGIPRSDLETSIDSALSKAATAYQKPLAGIPDTDLTEEVNMALERGANSYVKPDTGIPENHLAQDVKDKINNAAAKADAALPKSGGTLTGTVQLVPGTTGIGVKFGDNLRVYGDNTNLQIEGSKNGVLWGSVTITGIATPTQNNGVANKEYVDAAVAAVQAGTAATVHYYTNASFEDTSLSTILYGQIYYDGASGSGVANVTFGTLFTKFVNGAPFTLRIDDPEQSSSTYLKFDYSGLDASGADALYGHFFDSSGMRRFRATESGIAEIK